MIIEIICTFDALNEGGTRMEGSSGPLLTSCREGGTSTLEGGLVDGDGRSGDGGLIGVCVLLPELSDQGLLLLATEHPTVVPTSIDLTASNGEGGSVFAALRGLVVVVVVSKGTGGNSVFGGECTKRNRRPAVLILIEE
jgi:hypothetical protein